MSRTKRNRYNKTPIKRKKKIETSKLILAYVLILTTITTIFTLVMVAITMDTSPLSYLIPAIFAELATGTGFYYSKAKAENEIKIGRRYKDIEPYKEEEEYGEH